MRSSCRTHGSRPRCGRRPAELWCHQTRSFFLLFVVLLLPLKVTDPTVAVKAPAAAADHER
ncbi:hypothetical protein GFL54_14360 [Rhizobium laguerreae]|nr:hypothetical protein [Rhizobium laguerreae]OOO48026.1 hypothetical protein BS630_17410 [Rhizobium laguerreae]